MAQCFVGTSGWHYDDWRGRFYPEKIAKNKWLEYYAQNFSTVELNNTFYRLPSEKAVNEWYRISPTSFIYSVKVSRFITHIKRLRDSKEGINLFISKVSPLKEKLGPLLYQFPPDMERNDGRLEDFLSILPKEYRHVLEFRHKSWFTHGTYKLLGKYNAGFCIYDMLGARSPVIVTTDYAYFRFHGKDSVYSSRYTDKDMQAWAEKISELSKGLQAVYVYFNNDTDGHAIDNAFTIKSFLDRINQI